MERVPGIGGYFMRAAGPAVLSAWYRDCLGLDADENGLWRPGAGPTVFATFESGTGVALGGRADSGGALWITSGWYAALGLWRGSRSWWLIRDMPGEVPDPGCRDGHDLPSRSFSPLARPWDGHVMPAASAIAATRTRPSAIARSGT